MSDDAIIRSILDDDLYKLSMQSAVLALYPDWQMRAAFTNRGGTAMPADMGRCLRHQVERMADLALTADEAAWLAGDPDLSWTSAAYIDFLRNYRFDPDEVTVEQVGGDLAVIIEGPWHRAIRWEVPLLATISELYFRETGQAPDRQRFHISLVEKTDMFRQHGCRVVDFGTRRRASARIHDELGRAMAGDRDVFVGSSNLDIARRHGLKPVGTHAHEWFMAHQAVHGARDANRRALEAWLGAHGGQLAVALTDTFTTASFLTAFDEPLASRYDGVRQDSGDPIEWGQAMATHYRRHGIDPSTKVAVFSDSLDARRAVDLQRVFGETFDVVFGIGTHLTNDCGLQPLNIVIKATAFRCGPADPWHGAVKLSDDPGKHHGSAADVARVREAIAGC